MKRHMKMLNDPIQHQTPKTTHNTMSSLVEAEEVV